MKTRTVLRAHYRAMFAYVPRPCTDRVLFFRAEERSDWDPQYPDAAWAGIAQGGIEVHVVPGDHISMHHDGNVERLAEILRQRLRGIGAV